MTASIKITSSEEIFETSGVQIFKDKVIFKNSLLTEQSIPINQITTINLGKFGFHENQVIIETIDNKKYKIFIKASDQKKFRDTIHQVQQLNKERTVKTSETISRDKKKCPFCAELIIVEAKKCRYCGEFLDKSKEV